MFKGEGKKKGVYITRDLSGFAIYTSPRCDAPTSVSPYRCGFTRQFPGSARSFTISGIINGSKPETVTVLPGWQFTGETGYFGGHLLDEGALARATVGIVRGRRARDRSRFRGCDATRRRMRAVRNRGDGRKRRPESFRETTVEIEQHQPPWRSTSLFLSLFLHPTWEM